MNFLPYAIAIGLAAAPVNAKEMPKAYSQHPTPAGYALWASLVFGGTAALIAVSKPPKK